MTFLRNVWYVAAHATEVDGGPIGRTILNEPVVLFRTELGLPVALDENCPHRFAPLSRGKVVGETLQCPYHGLQFNAEGRCARTPQGGEPPPRARVRSYPLVERHGYMFIWMGEPELADPTKIPDLGEVVDPAIDWFRFTLHAKANYQLLVDNLLDLTHAEFLHPLLSSDGWSARNVSTCSREGDMIKVYNEAEGDNILPIMAILKPHLKPVGRTIMNERWFAPAVILLNVEYYSDGDDIKFPSAHVLTPETETTTHYFVCGGQTIDPSNPEITAQLREGTREVFSTQDVPLIEGQQRFIGERDLMALEPAILKMDQGAVLARRHLAKLIRHEQARVAVAAE